MPELILDPPGTTRPARRTRAEVRAICDLLEANLAALHGLSQHLRKLDETRALLYVALREIIIANDNEPTRRV